MDIEKYIDKDLIGKFEFYNYGHALEILHNAFPTEWGELQESLRGLKLTLADIKKSGGNESPIPKKFDDVTRAEALNDIFKKEKDDNGQLLIKKYGASTTWMGKLRYRLDSRRNGGCPVLAVGIGKECVEEYGRLNGYCTKLKGIYEGKKI